MLYCEIINANGETLPLTQENGYAVYELQGISPAVADISKTSKFGLDGSAITNTRTQERNINLLMFLIGEPEAARLNMYHFMRPSDSITLHIIGETRNLYIDGVIEDIQVDYHENPQNVEITMICPHPYFRNADISSGSIGKTTPLFEFPFSNVVGETFEFGRVNENDYIMIDYDGDVESGMRIELVCEQIAKNPKILNDTTGEFMGLNITLDAGDVITITTSNGQKKILRQGATGTHNIFNRKVKNSSWLKLRRGENRFSLDAEEGLAGINMTITYADEYIGV